MLLIEDTTIKRFCRLQLEAIKVPLYTFKYTIFATLLVLIRGLVLPACFYKYWNARKPLRYTYNKEIAATTRNGFKFIYEET